MSILNTMQEFSGNKLLIWNCPWCWTPQSNYNPPPSLPLNIPLSPPFSLIPSSLLLGAGSSLGHPVRASLSVSAVCVCVFPHGAQRCRNISRDISSPALKDFFFRQNVVQQRSVCSREASWIGGRRGGEAAEITNWVLWWDILEVQEFGFSELSTVHRGGRHGFFSLHTRPVSFVRVTVVNYCWH